LKYFPKAALNLASSCLGIVSQGGKIVSQGGKILKIFIFLLLNIHFQLSELKVYCGLTGHLLWKI
jgi:hypothetical protein